MDKIALDTNIAIDLLNGKSEVIASINKFDLVCLPVTVCGELLFGAKNSGKSKANELKYKNFVNACLILETNSLVAEKYADIRFALKQKGKPIPENDIWIAAICAVNNIPLFTRDAHFENVEELKLIDT
jgi:tRNA(fMet)-specific endonuclease VapC